ncbi:MAG: TetR/AcrR family transcriptional regulator [Myxococcales bacterium]|nr:TetR/AcrR family transcriptional regulator [Myxococcales bacterium]
MAVRDPSVAPVGDKYDAILAAALRLFVDRGFHGTAVPELARAAGVAAGTIYHYFPGKTALVNVLYRRWKEAVARTIYAAFPATATPREQFAAIWGAMATFAHDQPHAFEFLELHHHRSYLDAESLRLDTGLQDFGAGFVRAAQAAGVVKAGDPHLLMELVFGGFTRMMRAHWEGRLPTLDAATLALAEQACWDAIATHAAG